MKHTFLNPGDEIDFKVIALTPHQVTCVFNPQKSQITIKIDNDSLVTEADFEVSYSFKQKPKVDEIVTLVRPKKLDITIPDAEQEKSKTPYENLYLSFNSKQDCDLILRYLIPKPKFNSVRDIMNSFKERAV